MDRLKGYLPLIVVFFLLVQATVFAQREPVKVACLGNSVTAGLGMAIRAKDSWLPQLQVLLGDRYSVKNAGVSGATLLKMGHNPYSKTFKWLSLFLTQSIC